MSRELVPEIHDAFKLTTYGHVYLGHEKYPDFPSTRFEGAIPKTKTWKGIIGHHCQKGFLSHPTSTLPETFLLNMADGLASSFSRVKSPEKGEIEEDRVEETDKYVVYKIWHPDKEGRDQRLESDAQVRGLLEFLSKDPSAEEFFGRYNSILRTRPEEANRGKNVTSLFTHCKLTGKFYRILSKEFDKSSLSIGNTLEEVASNRKLKKDKEWKLLVARCRFRFHQNPMRARDINIFIQLEEVIKQVKAYFNDNIIFSTSEEVVLIYSKAEDLDAVQAIAIENGLWLELEVTEPTVLGKLTPVPGRKDVDPKSKYGELPESIEPPLCDICQMRKGEEWSEILKREGRLKSMGVLPEEVPTEHLCETCSSIRLKRAPLGKLRDWIDQGEDFRLAWIKIKLDYDQLGEILHRLYCDYLSSLGLSPAEAQVRFSIVSEFQEDYDKFLSDFRDRIMEEFRKEDVERVLEDFYCVKTESAKDVLQLLKIYKELLNNHFSKFLNLSIDSPLTLSVVLAPSKFPFFQCWRVIENSKPDIHIVLSNHGEMTIRNKMLDSLLLASDTKYRKSALHKLAEVSRLSEALAKLRFEDKSKDEDSQTYEQLRERLLPLGLGFRDILTFARILED